MIRRIPAFMLAVALVVAAWACGASGDRPAEVSPECAAAFTRYQSQLDADPDVDEVPLQVETLERCASKADWLAGAELFRGQGLLFPPKVDLEDVWFGFCGGNARQPACEGAGGGPR